MDVTSRLEKTKDVREKAASSCLKVLTKILKSDEKISEVKFKNLWLKELSKYNDIEKGGWYDPPPGGIGSIFTYEGNYKRLNYPTLRPEKYWQQDNVYFDSLGLGYLFASPYSMIEKVPTIGDFGFTYYLGKTTKIKDHYKKCYELLNKLIENIKQGMRFKELFTSSSEIIEINKLKIYMFSITDKAKVSMGHTIPFICQDPESTQQKDINSAQPPKIHNSISRARIFISSQEEYIVSKNCAFTFEPRMLATSDKSLPMFSFHTIIQFVNGKKKVLSNMDKIINLLNMEWIYV